MFEAGRRVRCICADWVCLENGRALFDRPRCGGVYTVIGEREARNGMETVRLFELAEYPPICGWIQGWQAEAFVPLEDAEFERLREACLKDCLPPPLKAREPAAAPA